MWKQIGNSSSSHSALLLGDKKERRFRSNLEETLRGEYQITPFIGVGDEGTPVLSLFIERTDCPIKDFYVDISLPVPVRLHCAYRALRLLNMVDDCRDTDAMEAYVLCGGSLQLEESVVVPARLEALLGPDKLVEAAAALLPNALSVLTAASEQFPVDEDEIQSEWDEGRLDPHELRGLESSFGVVTKERRQEQLRIAAEIEPDILEYIEFAGAVEFTEPLIEYVGKLASYTPPGWPRDRRLAVAIAAGTTSLLMIEAQYRARQTGVEIYILDRSAATLAALFMRERRGGLPEALTTSEYIDQIQKEADCLASGTTLRR